VGLRCGQSVPIVGRARNPLLLDPIAELDFFEEQHRYRWRGDWVLDNVSEVCSDELTPFAKKRIEETRLGPDGWELRGRTIHRCLDAQLTNQPFVHEDRWDAWLDPLLDEPMFKGIETLATEFRLVDRYNNVAGSFDFLVSSDAGVTLGDLKTVGSRKAVSGRKPATRQLGAYAKMLSQHFGHIRIDRCVTVVSGPERCRVITEDPQECIEAWEEALGVYRAKQDAAFDF
jgi:hypothetical protein